MKKIDSQALDILTKALGLQGPGSPVTELTDGIVDQVLEVGPIIRRSRTQAQTAGIYTAAMRNIHGAADSTTSTITPYAAGATAFAPYPSPMPAGFDIWLLSAAVTQLSGTGTISAALRVVIPATVMGISTLGGVVGAVTNVAFWDTILTESTTFAVKGAISEPSTRIGMRLPRSASTSLIFATTSSAIATFDCFLVLGVFPVALGQDVIV